MCVLVLGFATRRMKAVGLVGWFTHVRKCEKLGEHPRQKGPPVLGSSHSHHYGRSEGFCPRSLEEIRRCNVAGVDFRGLWPGKL